MVCIMSACAGRSCRASGVSDRKPGVPFAYAFNKRRRENRRESQWWRETYLRHDEIRSKKGAPGSSEGGEAGSGGGTAIVPILQTQGTSSERSDNFLRYL